MPSPPPLSPFLIVGMLMPPGGKRAIEAILRFSLSAVWAERPGIGDRLRSFGPLVYRIEPTDLPLSILLQIDDDGPSVRVIKPADPAECTAVVKGPVADLLAMLRGDADGDALFFSRTITIEGATDAVVALRNALDDAGVDLVADVTARLGVVGRPVRALLGGADALSRRFTSDLVMMADAVRGPLVRRVDAQGHILSEVEDRLEKIEQNNRRKAAL